MRKIAIVMVSSLLIAGLAGCKNDVKIIAHRGASHLAPENTLAAVTLGWQENADGVEIDVYLSKDDRIMVSHDQNTKRMSGIDLEIGQTASEQLRQLDVGFFKGQEFAGQKIPFLEEVLATIPPGKTLFIEVKCGKEILPFLQKSIAESGKQTQVSIIGFNLQTMNAAKALMPQIPVYWLCGTTVDKETKQPIPYETRLIEKAKKNGLDGLNVDCSGVTEQFAKAVKNSGLKFYVWTINDIDPAVKMRKFGVDGITTDRPDWLREQLQHYK